MASITFGDTGVSFDAIAREWRCKFTGAPGESASLKALQALIDAHLAEIKAIAGVASVQRVVCGGCLDFKIVVKVGLATHGDWANAAFAPEALILSKMQAIEGVSQVESQSYTLQDL
ncbi:hypothetical protein M885DRAFT_610148 [Pelagophyceae sp. CCMP2097]|nr:hypothetical protein M885DRAFT_610148 [Pelagophyceae sp. CCMP2097]